MVSIKCLLWIYSSYKSVLVIFTFHFCLSVYVDFYQLINSYIRPSRDHQSTKTSFDTQTYWHLTKTNSVETFCWINWEQDQCAEFLFLSSFPVSTTVQQSLPINMIEHPFHNLFLQLLTLLHNDILTYIQWHTIILSQHTASHKDLNELQGYSMWKVQSTRSCACQTKPGPLNSSYVKIFQLQVYLT